MSSPHEPDPAIRAADAEIPASAAPIARRYRPLAEAFRDIVADGAPAALHVRQGTGPVVDLAGGRTADGRPFSTRRPVFLYSAVKPVAALTVLLAVAEGRLSLDTRVAEHWPAFAAHGKGEVTVRQALAHGAGVPGWREEVTVASLADRPAAAEALAAQPPWWPPGEPAEHAVSYGHLLDGILRHATGDDIVRWWRRLQRATGVAVDLRPAGGDRAPAPLEDPDRRWHDVQMAAPGPMGRLLRNPAELLDVEAVDGPAVRDLVAPAVTGYGSAADLSALWAWWAGADAAAVLGRDLQRESLRPQVVGRDHVLERPVAWGLGPQIDDEEVGMGGVGGCAGWFDRDLGLAFGFTTARVGISDRLDRLEEAIASLR